jgi:hypothetical protein
MRATCAALMKEALAPSGQPTLTIRSPAPAYPMPMLHAVQPTEAVHAAIASLDGTLSLARALVEGGRRIDLAGLERETTSLCAAVMALRVEEAKRLRPALLSLRSQVDGLAARLAEA